MKKINYVWFLTIFVALFSLSLNAQVLITNYDFVGATGCTATPVSNAAGTTSAFSTSTAICTNPAGVVVTSPPAFVANSSTTTASTVSFSGVNVTPQYFQFQLGGASLNTFRSYQVFFQTQRSGTGPTDGVLQYSIDGATFTNFQTFTNPAAFSATGFTFDLSPVTTINNQASLFFRILMSNASAAGGTIRIDNFQIQALGPSAAQGTVAGRVKDEKGRGLSRVTVMITGNGLAEPLYATTNQFGNYQFEDIPLGEDYVLQVFSRRYVFEQQSLILNLSDSVSNADFIGSER